MDKPLIEVALCYLPQLRAVALKAGASDEADDAVQETIAAVLEREQRGDQGTIRSPRAFLATVCRRTAWRLRQSQEETTRFAGDPGDHGEGADALDDRVFLHEIWEKLNEEERDVVEALAYHGSQAEAARQLGVRRQRVNRVLDRVRAKTGGA